MAKTKETETRKSTISQEYVDDSSSDDSSSTASTGRKAAVTHNPKSKIEAQSSTTSGLDSNSTSGSDSEKSSTSTSSGHTHSKKRKLDRSKDFERPEVKKSKISNNLKTPAKSTLSVPAGYEPVSLDYTDFVAETANMFSNLDGKQVWHITAPASLPISTIQSLDIRAALGGEPILSHNDTNYNMFAASLAGEALLLPQGTKQEYSKVKIDISQNFHLREIAKPGTQPNGSQPQALPTDKRDDDREDSKLGTPIPHFFASREGEKKPVRQQPPGLLMRYQPYGSSTPSDRPYKLSRPEDEAKEENESGHARSNGFSMPDDIDGETPIKHVHSSKSRHKSKKETKGASKSKDVPKSDPMQVDDATDPSISTTPSTKIKKSRTKLDSERKRKDRE